MFDVRPVGEDIVAAIAALAADFLAAFAELHLALEVAPWSTGRPYVRTNPTGSRSVTFGPEGRGLVVYVVEDRERRVVWLWQVTVGPDLAP